MGNSIAIAAPNLSIAQSIQPANACPQLTNRRYVVLLDRPANLLPQLPEFLAIAAVPCTYLNGSMTFFGGFDNAQASTFRASQLRELGLDAIVHSFTAKVNDIPANLQGAAILVDPSNDPNAVLQRVRSLTGKGAVFATFSNRSVILAAPLFSQQSANSSAVLLRNQGLAAQVISAELISAPKAPDNLAPPNPVPTPNNPANPQNPDSSKKIIYRVLVPNSNANTLKLIRESAPDAFVTILKGKSYIQVRTYTNRSNAHRERDRLNSQFSGTILIQD
ncbi:hypothetical protein H6F42_16690 [Pseudanabaena sp. FACHB-1998]|uniref:hypothetical protein n=1 Tax=Pseudanabaena sp. FACHB-1998 TaxID=2692858 RepID=UPI0016807157|nr:hypothetical protein [Pseudanabaena sp. FACHB-1998]MBD2178556.1 hypothetical protein [Pseudanabaena sp. FACHB-1998]